MDPEAPKKQLKGGYRRINKTLNICAFEDYLEVQHSHLPAIADVEQISPRVIRVLGQNAGKVLSFRSHHHNNNKKCPGYQETVGLTQGK